MKALVDILKYLKDNAKEILLENLAQNILKQKSLEKTRFLFYTFISQALTKINIFSFSESFQ